MGYLLHIAGGSFCVCVKVLSKSLQHRFNLKQQYPRDIAPFTTAKEVVLNGPQACFFHSNFIDALDWSGSDTCIQLYAAAKS